MRGRALGVVVLLAAGVAAHAVTVRTWGPASAEGFVKGTLEGTSLDPEGWLGLAPTSATWWGPGAGIVWDVVADGERGAFVALSAPARVLRRGNGFPRRSIQGAVALFCQNQYHPGVLLCHGLTASITGTS